MKTKTITNGPHKIELVSSLINRGSVTFSCRPLNPRIRLINITEKVTVGITAIEAEDESGESWNIKGVELRTNMPFEGYYHSGNKTGILKVKSKKFEIIKKITEKF